MGQLIECFLPLFEALLELLVLLIDHLISAESAARN
jgi:hypothetical protein